MFRAVASLSVAPHFVLIDGPSGIRTPHPQKAIVDGDATCASIAAASIVAKVARDALMREADGRYPGYGLARNMGYGSEAHRAALRRLGPSRLHRRSFFQDALQASLF
jgi:ribonuclease HII